MKKKWKKKNWWIDILLNYVLSSTPQIPGSDVISMAWQSYVDNMKQQLVEKGGVYGLDGSPWHDVSCDSSLKATQAEAVNIISKIRAGPGIGSLTVEGLAYSEIRVVQDEFAMVKSKEGAKEDRGLCYAALGKTFLMIGFQKGAGERNVVKVIDGLRDHINATM